MNISAENLVVALQRVIGDYTDNQDMKMSIQDIADKANSGYTTIREIKNGSLKSLTAKKALEISKRLNGPSTLESLMEMSDFAKVNLKKYSQKFSHLFNYNIFPQNIEELFSNKDFSSIIWAAFGSGNISLDEIRYRWGQEGIDKTDYLIKIGLLQEDNGHIKGIAESGGFGIESAYKQAQLGLSLYKYNRSEKEENWMSFQTNSVNIEFIKKFREELRRVFKHFEEESEKEENVGNKRVFFNMTFDRYLEDLETNGEKLQ